MFVLLLSSVRSFDRNIGVNIWWDYVSFEEMYAAAKKRGFKGDPDRDWSYVKQNLQVIVKCLCIPVSFFVCS